MKSSRRARHGARTARRQGDPSKLLFGEDAADADEEKYTTEELDWFKNGSSTIPKGAKFEIMDCKTGKKFTVKRWSGANHIDAEPLTAEDSATMKSIYGGSWSWDRRGHPGQV